MIWSTPVWSQYQLTGNYAQHFDALGMSDLPGISNGDLSVIHPSLTGWYFHENGTGADNGITASDGSQVQGDTYNYGSVSQQDRALGVLQSGMVVSQVGFWFTNKTGQLITSLVISYTGEQWRMGSAGRSDKLDFQYSQSADRLDNEIWIDHHFLDFVAPVTTGSPRALDGNNAANKVTLSIHLQGLYIPPDAAFFLKWIDFNASNADDGLAIDDFQIVPGFAAPFTGFFRSISGGEWTEPGIWEHSMDGVNWSLSGFVPTSHGQQIIIRSGHHITFNSFSPVDEVMIESGAVLEHRNGILHVNNGPGEDITIRSGAVLQLSASANVPVLVTGATIDVTANGILRIAANGLTNIAGAGIHANGYLYRHQAILEYTLTTAFGSVGVTYFPNADENTIPVFRIMQNIGVSVGSVSPTIFNGVFEANGTITFTNSGQKIFRNGIRGTGNINGTNSGKFLVSGRTAELGGTGNLTVPVTAGLEIGSAQGTLVNLTSTKLITGNIALLNNGQENIIQTNANRLIITGTVSGGSPDSYVRANVITGGLTLRNVGPAGKLFPIGDETYNPVTVAISGDTKDISAVVRAGIWNPEIPIPSDAVNRTWNISANELTQAMVSFQYGNSPGELIGAAIPQPVPMELLQSDGETWHLSGGNTSLLPTILPGPVYRVTTNTPIGISTTSTAFALGRSGTIILNQKLFTGIEVFGNYDHNTVRFNVQIPNTCEQFDLEYSNNGSDFFHMTQIQAIADREGYTYADRYIKEGERYYRVKAVVPGTEPVYSSVVSATRKPKEQGLQVYPNPVRTVATIKISTNHAGKARLGIFTVQGREVYAEEISIRKGETVHFVPLNKFANGLYYVRIETNDGNFRSLFIKN